MSGATAIATFGDGTAYGCRVKIVKRDGDRVVVELADDPGFTVEDGTARHLFFPMREIPGKVICRIRTSAFARIGEGVTGSVGEATLSEAQ